jgi:predicted dehydrogenase
MKTVKMGYVGCGFMAQAVHIPNLTNLPGCELLAIAELREELAKKVQARYGIPRRYPHHQALAQDPEVEAVGVSAHFAVQGEIAVDLLRAGKDVFMEKPMAVSVPQAERILDAVRESGRRLMVGYMKRYDAGNELVKATIERLRETGELGEITYARNHGFCGRWTAGSDAVIEGTDEPLPAVEPLAGKPDWLPERLYGRYLGYLQQYTHNVNLLRWFLDAGEGGTVEGVHLGPDGLSGVVVLQLGGTRAVIESGQVDYHAWEEHTQLFFEQGWIKTRSAPLLLKNVPATVELYRATPQRQVQRLVPEPAWSWSYRREMAHFLSCIAQGLPFRSPAEDTLNDVRLLEEVYRAYLAQDQEKGSHDG